MTSVQGLTNIEIINVENTTSGALSLNLSSAGQLQEVINENSVGNLTISGIVKTANLNVQAIDGFDTTFVLSGVSGTADVANLYVDDVNNTGEDAANITIAGVETVNVTAENNESTYTLTVADANTINFAGDVDQSVTLGAGVNGVSLFNAAGATGGVELTVAAQTGLVAGSTVSVYGGSGNDALTVSNTANKVLLVGGAGADSLTATATNALTVDGGQGNDTISVTGTTANGTASVSGGAGDDNITVATDAAATVHGGEGADIINATLINGTASIDAGGGNDNIVLGSLFATDTIVGGTGVDALSLGVQVVTTTIGSRVSEVETLTSSAALSQDLAVFTNTTLDRVNNYSNGAVTYTNASANIATLGLNGTGSSTTLARAVDTSNNSLTIALTNTGVNNIATAVTADYEESITITSNSTAVSPTLPGANSITNLNAADLTTLTVSGSANLGATEVIGSTQLASVTTTGATGTVALDVSDSIVNMTAILGAGNTILIAGSGNDTITVAGGNNTILGGDGSDNITGGSGNDSLVGGAGNDTITAGDGNNVVEGQEGNDTLTAGAGNDSIYAGTGNDVIFAGAGSDSVYAGSGSDSVTAGGGLDTIYFATGETLTSADTIVGDGTDILNLTGAAGALADADFTNVTGVQTITAGAATSLSLGLGAQADEAGFSVINGTAGQGIAITSVAAFNNNLTVNDASTTAAGALAINLGASASALTLNATDAAITAADVVVGGTSASDVVFLTASDGTADFDNVIGIDQLTIVASTTPTQGTTVNNAEVAASKTMTVDASALTLGDAAFTFTGSALGAGSTLGVFSVTSGAGNDDITVGAGSDTVTTGLGNDTVVAGAGDNVVTTGDGADSVTAGAGNDTINVGTGGAAGALQYVVAGDGNNVITAGDGINSVTAGSGNDTITLGAGGTAAANQVVEAGAGNNTVTVGSGTNSITTIDGNDTITAGDGNNTISAGAGNDVIVAGNGGTSLINQVITASAGNNSITVGNGVNSITAGAGNDTITVGTGNNTIVSGEGADTITTAGGNGNITAGAGNDTITSGAGNEIINADAGQDVINAGDGNNSVDGGAGNDSITSGAGNDNLSGAAGNDTMSSGNGQDTLYGADGADSLTGGEGNDMYVYIEAAESASGKSATFNGDTVVGFNAGNGLPLGVVDKFQVGLGITQIREVTAVNVTTADLATLQTTLAANGNLTAALLQQGNVAVVTISAGTAAGQYIVVAGVAGQPYNSTNDLIIKIVDPVNIANLTSANFVPVIPTEVTLADAITTLTVNPSAYVGLNVTVIGTAEAFTAATPAQLTLVSTAVGVNALDPVGVPTFDVAQWNATTGKLVGEYDLEDTADNMVVGGVAVDAVSDAAAVTVDSTAATAAQLNAIVDAATVDVDADLVLTITGLTSDFVTLIASQTATDITLASDFDAVVTDSGTVQASQLNAIAADTTGMVTAAGVTTIQGTIAVTQSTVTDNTILLANLATVLLTDTSATAAALNTLDGLTAAAINAATVTTITGDLSAFGTLIASAITLNTGYNAVVTDSGTVQASQLNAIAADTTGTVTSANVTDITGTATVCLTALNNPQLISLGAVNVTVNDPNGSALTATTLSEIALATSGNVTVSNAVTITGTDGQITAALITEGVVAASANLTVSDAAATALTATSLTALAQTTAGTVTVSNAVALSGTDAQLTTALITEGVVAASANLTVSDAAATALTATSLTALAQTTAGTVTVSNAVDLAGSAAQFNTMYNIEGVVANSADLDVTGTSTVADINWMPTKTTGNVVAENIVDNYLAIAGASATLINAALSVTANGTNAANNIDMSVFTNGIIINALGANDTVTGSTGDDVITGGTGADVITGFGGSDTFVYATDATGITLATADTITDFVTANDVISTGIVDLVAGEVTIADGAGDNFADFVLAAEAVFLAGDEVYVAYNADASGNAWVAINNNGGVTFTTGDSLIVLTGINLGAEINATDFTA